jgi:hypothetical protein
MPRHPARAGRVSAHGRAIESAGHKYAQRNICLHYLIATEGMWHKHRHKEEREHALTRIAGLWDREPSYVPDILTEHREAAQTWLDNLLEYNSDFAKPEEILKALDADLMLRAASWPRHREGQ